MDLFGADGLYRTYTYHKSCIRMAYFVDTLHLFFRHLPGGLGATIEAYFATNHWNS